MKNPIQSILTFIFLISLGLNVYFIFNNNTEVIKVPAIVGSIKPAPIIHLEPTGEPLNVVWRDKTITVKEPVNDSLFKAYKDLELKYQDKELQLQQALMFLDAITLREFESEFEDPFLKLKVKGTVQGRLKRIEIEEYEIKEQEVKAPQPKMITFGLQAGYGFTVYGETPYVGVGVNLDFEQAIRKLLKR